MLIEVVEEYCGHGNFDTPLEDNKGIVRITNFVALRAVEDIRQFAPYRPEEYEIDEETGELIPPQHTPVHYLNDALHIGFETTTAFEGDLGWISTNYSVEDAKIKATKGSVALGRLQSGIWRYTEVAERSTT